MHGDTLSFADTFDRALAGIVSPQAAEEAVPTSGHFTTAISAAAARTANEAFARYLEMQGQGRFAEAAVQLERLQRALRDLQPASRSRP